MRQLYDETETLEGFNPYHMVLDKPISFGKETIERLTLRDLTSRELRMLKINGDMSFGDLLDIGQKLAEINRRVIDQLSKKDSFALVERVGFLLEDGI